MQVSALFHMIVTRSQESETEFAVAVVARKDSAGHTTGIVIRSPTGQEFSVVQDDDTLHVSDSVAIRAVALEGKVGDVRVSEGKRREWIVDVDPKYSKMLPARLALLRLGDRRVRANVSTCLLAEPRGSKSERLFLLWLTLRIETMAAGCEVDAKLLDGDIVALSSVVPAPMTPIAETLFSPSASSYSSSCASSFADHASLGPPPPPPFTQQISVLHVDRRTSGSDAAISTHGSTGAHELGASPLADNTRSADPETALPAHIPEPY